MDQKKIDRINALYHKSKAEGLTEAEKKEQALLRKEYIASVRSNLRAQLNNIDVKEADVSMSLINILRCRRIDFFIYMC